MTVTKDDPEAFALEELRCALVVSNLPAIPEDKHAKLHAVVSKIFSQLGTVRALDMPVTGGYAVVEYASAAEARRALQRTDGYKLDKSHVLRVQLLGEVERLRELDVQHPWEPPSELAAELSDEVVQLVSARPNLWSHLADPRGRDQFVLCAGADTAVYWFDPVLPPELAYERSNWTESGVRWSPLGSYLATFHRQGVALWGGGEFEKIVRFAHDHPRLIHFSRNESYLVSYNAPDAPEPLIVWEADTGRKLRAFPGPLRLPQRLLDALWNQVFEERAKAEAANPMLAQMQATETRRLEAARASGTPPVGIGRFPWPLIQFSADETLMAQLGDDCVHVYGPLPEQVGLVDRRPVPAHGVSGMEWSPAANILALWSPEEGQSPARVLLLEMPSRRELRQKALYSVAQIELLWHPQGKYLACRVDRLTRSRKGRFTTFEIFRVNERDVPVEVLEFSERDRVSAFAWEPKGDRFAVLHQEVPAAVPAGAAAAATTATAALRPVVTFYEVQRDALRSLFSLERKQCNRLHWSPSGAGHILLAGLGSMGGVLEWWNVPEQELMGMNEHFACTDIEWDPSGRFVTTWVSATASRIEHGYQMWTFYGRKVGGAVAVENLFELAWRPRPRRWLLSADEERQVRRELKQYRVRYEAEDVALREQQRSGARVARREALAEWQALVERARARYAAEAEARARLWAGVPGAREAVRAAPAAAAEEEEEIEDVVEEVLEEKEEVLQKWLSEEDERD
ncbi:hypothetical protein CDCA_CDCA16G4283 [Cyanidium caldarium]|uniref:Eukaryotic translation initiation factor 3 subunit B n=1 Tax=Cyanidium caldarium TaxID=2771 RepID=A0AAV9J0Y6_CYACA|nr:hypothetical protein CDCA_CDCA16G4283 [Cyanidium caldarium]